MMQWKKTLLLSILPVLVAGCTPNSSSTTSDSGNQSLSTQSESTSLPSLPPSSSAIVDGEPLLDNAGNILVDIYGLNDFHGAVAAQETSSGTEIGLSTIGAFLKAKESENPYATIITASGDMWQGSADSNLTKGLLVTEMMNYIGFDAMAIGNHEFDWGANEIIANRANANFPFLSANLLNKSTNEISDLADAYTLIDLGQIQIGIIGTIGDYLESSILASAVANYTFEPEASYVQAAKAELDSLGADATILLTHDSWVNLDTEAAQIINQGGEAYVDAVLCGHAHASDAHLENGVPVLQTSGNGQEIMHARLAVHPTSGQVIAVTYERISAEVITPYGPDASLDAVYDYYYQKDIKAIKEEQLITLPNSMTQSELGAKTVEAMYKAAQAVEPEVLVAVHNSGGVRAALPQGIITYGDVYKALPFDNYTAIVTIKGSDLQGQLSRQLSYPSGLTIDINANYRVMIISYLMENQYWSPIISQPVMLETPSGSLYYPRDIVADAMRNGTF